ncbi:MAG: helix-turn-helix domain-containing protein [Sandaracinaceae bacterium]|nr:helix-turn-helix domain-containing protein [Sandaracinaceae bacterium]
MAGAKLEWDSPEDEADYHAFLRHIGARVRELRTMQGVSVLALAEFTGIDHRQIQRIEAGHVNVTAKTAFRIARALAVPPSELYVSQEQSSVRPRKSQGGARG